MKDSFLLNCRSCLKKNHILFPYEKIILSIYTIFLKLSHIHFTAEETDKIPITIIEK